LKGDSEVKVMKTVKLADLDMPSAFVWGTVGSCEIPVRLCGQFLTQDSDLFHSYIQTTSASCGFSAHFLAM